MARHKPDPLIINTLDEATVLVGEIAAMDRELAMIDVAMREEIDAAKTRAKNKAEGIALKRKARSDAVAVFASMNRAELFSDSKTLDLGYGKIGFRMSPPSIVQERGVTAEMSLAKCRELGLTDGIRQKEELNKENLLGWPDERLGIIGVRRQQRETFFIDTPQEGAPTGM